MSASKRIELKFPLDPCRLQRLESDLVFSVPSIYRPFPDRTIHSVYWDSHSQQDYFDNVAGTTPRRKVRLRWYGEDTKNAQLEIKEKQVRVSWKHVTNVVENRKLSDIIKQPVTENLRTNGGLFHDALRARPLASLYAKYRRKYFTTAREIRFTIDTDMRFADPNHIDLYCPSPVVGVLEVKYPVELEDEAASYVKKLSLQYYRHSKYVIGVDCLYR